MPILPSPEQVPMLARAVAGLLGLVLALRGARLYRVAVVAPGVLIGGALGAAGAAALGLAPLIEGLAALGLAILGGVVCAFAEAAAVRLAGLVVGAGVGQAIPGVPWWAIVVGAGVGVLLFPSVWRAALPILTATMGTLVVAWAVGQPASPWILVAGTTLGALIQWSARRETDDAHSKR